MEKQELEDLLNFSKEFRKKKEEEEKKLPYHVNVIDELHINENGHSRVLTKLLQYKNEKNEYEILQSLLDYIKQKNKNFEIKITNPKITQEKERIDLWVLDENYAIIFENKVYNAKDQEAQISRYIERTIEKKYKEDQIFVIYLSKEGKEPDQQSWGGYKEKFKSRYVNLSFRYDILPWLKELQKKLGEKSKEKYLQSAILQYIDYLEGNKMFRTGSIYKNMNMELDKLIEDHYTINDLEKLLNDKENIALVVEQMNRLCNKKFEKLYDDWRNDTKTVFENLEPCQNGYWPITQVTIKNFMECGNVNVSISGGHTDPYDSFYVGISPLPENKREKVREELIKNESNIILPHVNQGIHEYFGITDYEKVYPFFKNLVNKCIDITYQYKSHNSVP